MAGAGFEPAKAEPTRLQRVPFDRSGTPPGAADSLGPSLPAGVRLRLRPSSVPGGGPDRVRRAG